MALVHFFQKGKKRRREVCLADVPVTMSPRDRGPL
jgi:hypothetical protein